MNGSFPQKVNAIGTADKPIKNQDFNDLNPLKRNDVDPEASLQLSTPGGILTRVLYFALPIAGLILFAMLVWGGFEILSGAASSKSKEAGRQRVTAAIMGFFLLFASYWIVQLIQVIFDIKILG